MTQLKQEYICGLNVSVQNLMLVQQLETLKCLNYDPPDHLLLQVYLVSVTLHNHLINIFVSRQLHYDAAKCQRFLMVCVLT